MFTFIWGCVGSLSLRGCFSSCGKQGLLSSRLAQASQRKWFSCRGAQALQRMGVSSCGTRAQWVWLPGCRLNSCGTQLSCSRACGIFLDQGPNPCVLHWQVDPLPLSHQRSPSDSFSVCQIDSIVKATNR